LIFVRNFYLFFYYRPIFGTDKLDSGIIPVIICENIIIASNVVISRPIFSPLSGGNENPNTLINDIKTHGNMRLTIKYNVLLRILITNITNGYLVFGQHSYEIDFEYEITSFFKLIIAVSL
jgi:hypothetical protein